MGLERRWALRRRRAFRWASLLLASIGCVACGGGDEPSPLPDAWTIAVLPDTQHYAEAYPDEFLAQTRWIAAEASARDIRFVLHEGDIVQHNREDEWRVARQAFDELRSTVPYVLTVGNHDYGPDGSATTRETLLGDFFPTDELEGSPSYGARYAAERTGNSYHVFETPSGPWLVLALELGPRDGVVEWADGVLARHAPMPAIVLTHAYLYSDGQRYDHRSRPDQQWSPHSYGLAMEDGGVNDGEALWQRLIRRHDHVRLVLCGHVLNDGTGHLRSVQDGGGIVHQLLANYQQLERGGSGYLRLIEMNASGDRARVVTYSPTLDTYLRDAENELWLHW
jgi:hypothetical protein